MQKKTVILYIFHEADLIGGATYSGVNMIKSLDKDKYEVVAMVSPGGSTIEKLASLGVKTIPAPIDVWMKNKRAKKKTFFRYYANMCRCLINHIKYLLQDYRKVKKYLKRGEHIDIIHSNTTVVMAGYVLSKYLRCKHVWHLREFIDKDFGLQPFIGFRLLRKCINSADATISISKAVQQHWINGQSKNTFQFFNAVKKANNMKPIIEKEKYFLFCANCLSDFKGANIALEAFCESKLYKQDYKLIFIGDCDHTYKDKLLAIAHQYAVEESIVFLGYKRNVDSYFSKATAFLMCSENEAMGRTTIEAFFNGCLVLGRNTGGTPELIKDGVTGYLFNTIAQLVTLMKRIVGQDNTEMIKRSQDFALQNFTEECYGPKIMNVYDVIMRQK